MWDCRLMLRTLFGSVCWVFDLEFVEAPTVGNTDLFGSM